MRRTSLPCELEELNRARQDLDRAVLDDAMRLLDRPGMGDRYAFVLAREGWHAGVIGIVASRIVEHTARPAVLVAVDHGVGKGSGRSIAPFDLHAALGACAGHFQRFGGHRAAAGLTMDAANLPAFADQFDAVARERLCEDDLIPELRVDLDVSLDHVDDTLDKLMRHFEPFGVGNPAPVFRTTDARLASGPRKVGTDGLRLTLTAGQGSLEAIGWGMASRAATFDVSRPVDLAFRIERDEYRRLSCLQLKLADVRVRTMRIVAGRWRGRKIEAPAGDLVRPTGDRVRESWMSIVHSVLPDARVLDLCAGSGALGLEALSRGAAACDFVEMALPAVRVIEENLERLGRGNTRGPRSTASTPVNSCRPSARSRTMWPLPTRRMQPRPSGAGGMVVGGPFRCGLRY